MKKFFVFYLASPELVAKWREEGMTDESKKGMDEWMQWMKDHADIYVDKGGPLGKTKLVTAEGVSDTKNNITGYAIVQAESHEAAAQLFAGNPYFKMNGATMEVMEVSEMKGM